VLVTDGGQNVRPYIKDVTPQLTSAQIRVVSIAFGYANNIYQTINSTTYDFLLLKTLR
jgi:hypothetical protein